MKNMFFLILSLLSLNLYANIEICQSKDLDELPIQAGGRVKPLYVHAKETLKFLTKSKIENKTPSEIYCLLSLEGLGIPSNLVLFTKIEHVKTQKLLGKNEIHYPELLTKQELISQEIMSLKLNDAYKKDLNRLMQKIDTYKNLVSGTDWKFPVNQAKNWINLLEFLTEEKVSSYKAKSSQPFSLLFEDTKQEYIKNQNKEYLIELTYVKSHFFEIAMIISLLGIFTLTLIKNSKIGLGFVFGTLLVQIIAISLRVMISHRAPITNMYETVMFSGFGALLIATIIHFVLKEKIYLLAGLAYNILCLLMMTFANGMLNSSISPLVPVLRDNFWLSTHVTMVILSYAALALSWIISNITMIRRRFSSISTEDFNYNVNLAYNCIKIGVVMLAGGIILGGVWADYSWGRFWGWDPKETWSLIVLLIYMAILHGRFTSWISIEKFNFFVAGAFMSVMMAWFGVNYILASGLHSYGFSEGGAIFLGTFFLSQIGLILISSIKSEVRA
jgi:cytochrome c-type biogenesis protein CcsB